jgi:hypothetical protein
MDMLLATPQLVATLSFLLPCVAFRETSDGPLSLSLPTSLLPRASAKEGTQQASPEIPRTSGTNRSITGYAANGAKTVA